MTARVHDETYRQFDTLNRQGSVAGMSDGQLLEGVVAIPPGTKQLIVAPQIYWPGTVWFDDLEAEYTTIPRRTRSGRECVDEVSGHRRGRLGSVRPDGGIAWGSGDSLAGASGS